ncbi:MAG: germination protein YpeB [Clostridia bacterium]|nr:germination protein YpeB [Clostridia bacterium]
MSERAKSIIQRYLLPGLLAIALVAVSLWASRQRARAQSYRTAVEAVYAQAYGELTDDLYQLENTLSKLLAVSSPAQYVLLLDEVWRLSGSAVSNMSHLPVSHVDTAQLNQFIVRLGDYAHALTKKAVRGGIITGEDTAAIAKLRDSCASLAAEHEQKLSAGEIPSGDEDVYFVESEETQYKDGEDIARFPTLIYDGPFSESSEKLQPRGLTGPQVDQAGAEQTAERIAGLDMTFSGMSEGQIPAYDFSFSDEKGNWAEASVTRQGGMLLYYMSSAAGNAEGRPDEETGKRYRDIALEKLGELGYGEMQSAYAQYYGGVAVINFAPVQDGAILYSDLVKVWVDRETQRVCGIDARNYLFSHRPREIGQAAVSQEDAEGMLAPSLQVQSHAMALIPVTPETEVLCHEFKCTLGEDSYIIYINAANGQEEQIFKIIDSQDGQLVI